MKISVVGLGWYGSPLAGELLRREYQVAGTTRDEGKALGLTSRGIVAHLLSSPALPPPEVLECDALILNIPPHEGQLGWFKRWPLKEKTWVIFISSTSGRTELLQQETWVKSTFPTWTILRFAGLIGNGRHPGKSLSGKSGLKGRLTPVNLLHLEDAVGLTCAVIEKKIQHETIDVLCDEHHGKEEFYTEYAQRMGIPLPEFDQRDEIKRPALDNQRARELYAFKWPTMIGRAT